MKPTTKPRQILLSKRANIFYLEHARVMQMDDRVVYLTEASDTLSRYFNIPERNTSLLLLGKGTSLTDAAARKLAESNVMVGFCGSGGTPLFSQSSPVFLSPESEYRPTEYMQAWVKGWLDEHVRLAWAKLLLHERINLMQTTWAKDKHLLEATIKPPALAAAGFLKKVQACQTTQDLLLAEADWEKRLYAHLSKALGFEFSREEGKRSRETPADRVNSFLDHGNYLAYGLAAVALNGLGIGFAFPLLHGKTRRGALVFDIADLIKDAHVMPLAFIMGNDPKVSDNQFRVELIDRFHRHDVLDYLFEFAKNLPSKYEYISDT
ncbi:CRISPR-associated protein Cas1 [Chitinivorax tropicus]|uniref:CRISPR-associated endonuclease Cas1 n=1 Tax=Chitinivorax tropicus TaxID=714531 RepID=A0A840MPP6_9PROT|nr:type I-F CRISPR-associated endonuclease Cas1f [Chitinivorax tropicus]MBB5018456.1 CRISPR-associated protein Cas1 [Chitinivorax tropicus]